ncbi:hypothetical protein P3W85_34260 [Cupriavidus basilensis]|uniref:Transmembrane protein n=1 Tax=Cupriavidus basilensis TaxID=68895 RepID=A0ABT6AZA9_9BURK|nr:hypothetical protein [Cupriavidus basilensis]MDF3837960.1 hypothetical protein [Cupriavidus basilensis]
MYIVAIGWLYVVLMMAITEHTAVAGVATFVFYGLAPVALVVYIMGTPGRRRRRKAEEARLAQPGQATSDPSVSGEPRAPGTGEPPPAARN